MDNLQKQASVIREELKQALLENFGDPEVKPNRADVMRSINNSITSLVENGKIVKDQNTPNTKVNLLWDSWNHSQRATWTFCNIDFKDIGELTRRNIDRLNMVALEAYRESVKDQDDIDWTQCPQDKYPWWTITIHRP